MNSMYPVLLLVMVAQAQCAATTGDKRLLQAPGSEPRVTAQSVDPNASNAGGDLPPEFQSLYEPTVTPQAPGSAGATPTGAAQPVIGTLTSLLDPPPGFTPPALTPAQLANMPMLRQARQGLATITFRQALGPYDARDLNCGQGYVNEWFADHYVGLPAALYRGGELCGMCVRMWCVDSICKDALVANATFMVLDQCNDCRTASDLVVSPRGMAALAGVDTQVNPSLQVAWEFTPCGDKIVGGIKLLPHESITETFVGLNFSNLKTLIRAVSINGLPMTRTNYGFWVIQSEKDPIPLRPPYTLQVAGVNGQQLTVKVPALVAQDLDVNFNA